MQTELQLVLASASPRRRELLEQIGIHFLVQTADVDETPLAGESAVALVERLAANKAETVRNRRKVAGETDLPVLGSDTLGILDGRVAGKTG